MNLHKLILIAFTLVYAILWIGGIASYIFYEQPLPESNWAAPSFLFIAGMIVIISSERKHAFFLVIAGLLGFAFEILGINTGYPFGKYYYTDNIKPLIFNVPVVMITAWTVLTAFARQLLMNTKLKDKKLIFIGGLLMVWIDLLIDPVAIGPMNFWIWIDKGCYYGIPLLNFFGWFFVSSMVFIFLIRIKTTNIWHKYIGASIIMFFTIIAFAGHIFLAGIAGVGILILQIILEVKYKTQNSKKIGTNY